MTANPPHDEALEGLIERLRLHQSWRDSHGELNSAPFEAADALEALRSRLAQGDGWQDIRQRITDLLACSSGGCVTFAVEPERSSIQVWFNKRDEAGEFSRILTDLHPVDDEGCFVHNRPLPAPPALSNTVIVSDHE